MIYVYAYIYIYTTEANLLSTSSLGVQPMLPWPILTQRNNTTTMNNLPFSKRVVHPAPPASEQRSTWDLVLHPAKIPARAQHTKHELSSLRNDDSPSNFGVPLFQPNIKPLLASVVNPTVMKAGSVS